MVNQVLFRQNIPRIEPIIANTLTVSMVWQNGQMRSLHDINMDFENRISLVTYMRLAGFFRNADKKIFCRYDGPEGSTVGKFLQRFKKGSQKFRLILTMGKSVVNSRLGDKNVLSYLKITGIGLIPAVCKLYKDSMLLGWWAYGFFPNRVRDFLFKFTHNILGINSRVAHFNNNVSAGCTMCMLEKKIPTPAETFVHLFFECPVSEIIYKKADTEWWPGINFVTIEEKKKFWLCGLTLAKMPRHSIFVQVIIGLVHYYIWECKLKRQKLSWDSCKAMVLGGAKSVCKISGKVKHDKSSNYDNFPICRQW
jgi:hypothetical protein